MIPAALGGTWAVMDVCEACQERGNVEIDRPFTQSLWVPVITVSIDDEADYIAKKIKRSERDNPGFTWNTTKREIAPHVPLKVSFQFSIPMTLWRRFAVKVALTVGRELSPELTLAERGLGLGHDHDDAA
jgi:hypothetical protein